MTYKSGVYKYATG
jgi:cathepsin B